MGLFRIYLTQPTFIPKGDSNIHTIVNAPTLEASQRSEALEQIAPESQPEITPETLYSAFSSPTAGLLMCWQYSGTNEKSGAELNRLWSFVTDPQFQPSLQSTFNHERKKKQIEKYLHNQSNPFNTDYGWEKLVVSIPLPHEGSSWPLGEHGPSVPTLIVDGIYHRDIIDIVTSMFQDQISSEFHLTPFEEYWQPNTEADPIKVFGEAYSSHKAVDLYHNVHSLPRQPEDNLERVVVPILLWSDATQLSNFGDVSLWPIYMFFGNQSKYTRGKPTEAACHHIAYIPTVCHHHWISIILTHVQVQLPDNFQDTYSRFFDEGSSSDVYTHCKRDLMQAIWRLLLNEKFVEAYNSGFVIKFVDGIVRHIFIRFYTYGADYPEKYITKLIMI
jgi:hypothetical protein